ncbi:MULTISPECIES: hypothetical protein [Actinoplanes]|uniref:Uncharacterized protein n=2 Tax=Actinoplanes TaxID=1865 RepID=A0A101JT82_9ACTN|nr:MULTISPECIES: hypothetical protein [Actinoplanes]KUL32645.1 hypothetical protein ADL15_19205 [Actinoplanes awajinensis subsp. mycoplanecinus]GIE70152.1 hypothetical protein Apa02nite_062600 [Actinoplanes palleronii]
MRSVYRALSGLILIGFVVQIAAIAAAWFQVLNDVDDGGVFDNNTRNWAHIVHAVVGAEVIPLLALALLVVSFFARIPGGVKWAALTFGAVVLQVVLAFAGYSVPGVGALHGLNALVVAGLASVAMRKAREADAKPAPPVAVA